MSAPAEAQKSTGDILRGLLQSEGPKWSFIFKTFAAAMLALFVAFRLGFDSPGTAMTTVFVVAQPQTGLVLAKSFYRILGTFVGLVMTIVFVSLFAQYQELFLIAITIWVGLCVAGAAWFRDFQAYGFLLAGYTSCLIGFPAVMQPNAVFQVAVTRVSEIMLGILSVTVIGDAIFPLRLSPKLVVTVRGQFARFFGFLSQATAEPLDRTVTPADQLKFVADILTLESLRAATLFEDPHSRIRSDRLRLFNADFMKVSTTLHAVQQLARRMRAAGKLKALAVLRPCVNALGPELLVEGRAPAMAAEALPVVRQLAAYRPVLRRRLREGRAHLATEVSADELLAFDCAAELLELLVDELHDYAATYASLAEARSRPDRPAPELVFFTHPMEALLACLRATGAMLVLCWFWISTAWPEGAGAAAIACVGCALFAASPDPVRSVRQMGLGFGLGMIAAYFLDFHVLVHMDGFLLMAAGMLPFIMLGVWITAHPKTAGVGAGFNLMVSNALPMSNVMHYNTVAFMNNGIAQIIGICVAGVAFSLLQHREPAAVRARIGRRLRRELVRASEDSLRNLPHAFDGRTRDLMRQLMGQPKETCNYLMPCALSVLELGDAIVDLRLASARHFPERLKAALEEGLEKLKQGFERPDGETRADALAVLESLMQDITAAQRYQAYAGSEREAMDRVERCLHRIYSVWRDNEWFAAFSGEAPASKEGEVAHAA